MPSTNLSTKCLKINRYISKFLGKYFKIKTRINNFAFEKVQNYPSFMLFTASEKKFSKEFFKLKFQELKPKRRNKWLYKAVKYFFWFFDKHGCYRMILDVSLMTFFTLQRVFTREGRKCFKCIFFRTKEREIVDLLLKDLKDDFVY